jgi:hypothetical protein
MSSPSGDQMAEILTESFCERCGSRYTFESEVPRARLRGVRVLSRGFKNFVLDDKTSIDEAMAAARDDTDRALTAHQLEAFHKTFNFCMQCRQYICPNCWNASDGHCLTCSPVFGHGNLPASFPDLDPALGVALPDEAGLAAAAMNGHTHVSDESNDLDIAGRAEGLTPTPTPAPEMIGGEVEAAAAEALAAEAVLAEAVAGTGPESPDDTFAAAEVVVEADSVPAVEVHIAEPDVSLDQGFTAEGEPDAIADVVPSLAVVDPLEEPVASVEAEAPDVVEATSADVESSSDRAGAEPEPPVLLLAGLRPGESLDDAIAAFESAAETPEGLGQPETEVPEDVSAVEAPPAPMAAEPPTEVEAPDLPAGPEAAVLDDALVGPAITPDAVAFGAVAEPADALWASPAEPSVDIPIAADSAEPEPEPVSLVEPLDDAPTDAVAAEAVVEAPFESHLDDVAAVAALSLESEWLQPAEPAAPEPLVEAAPEPAIEVEAAPEPAIEVEAAPEPEPQVQAAPEPEPLVEAAPEPAPPAAPESPEIAAAAASVDVVAQPTWSIVAPDPTTVADVSGPVADPAVEIPAPAQDPDWPAQPQWPSPLPSAGLPFLGRPVVPSGGVEALWAESDRAVTAPQTGTERASGGIQPCVSCGLSLSATARFCRRCGTSQVG